MHTPDAIKSIPPWIPRIQLDAHVGEFIEQDLRARGIYSDNLFFRTYYFERAGVATRTGTDRDDSSHISYHGHEAELMRKAGLSEYINAKYVTWVTSMRHLRNLQTKGPMGVSIYNGEHLQFLETASGFCTFKRKAPLLALVATYVREPAKKAQVTAIHIDESSIWHHEHRTFKEAVKFVEP
jgi:hypothetical protein